MTADIATPHPSRRISPLLRRVFFSSLTAVPLTGVIPCCRSAVRPAASCSAH